MFKITMNNHYILAISWKSLLLVEETRRHGENKVTSSCL